MSCYANPRATVHRWSRRMLTGQKFRWIDGGADHTLPRSWHMRGFAGTARERYILLA